MQIDAVSDDDEERFTHFVKIINPNKKTEYSTKTWHDASRKFKSVRKLRSQLKRSLHDQLPDTHEDDIEFGYVSPGHGAKGQQLWVTNGSDLKEMYASHAGKKKIMIWFFAESKGASTKKRPRSSENATSSKRSCKSDAHSSKLEEVDKIVTELEKKHSGKYSREQLNVWAHMIQLKKHDSREVPPDKPFFRASKVRKAPVDESVSASNTSVSGITPCACIPWQENRSTH